MPAVTTLQDYQHAFVVLAIACGVLIIMMCVSEQMRWRAGERVKDLEQELRDLHQEIRIFHHAGSDMDRQFAATLGEIRRANNRRH